MNGVECWKKENRVQRFIRSAYINSYNYFKPDRSKCKFEIYSPKIKRWKMSLGVVGVLGCLFTPGTNLLIPFIVRWILR